MILAAFSAACVIVILPLAPVAKAAGEPFVTEIASGIFVHRGREETPSPANGGDVSNCGFVVGDVSVAVIDTCGSAGLGARLRAAIRDVTAKPIRYVINTHMHPDHVFGNAAFEADKPDFVANHKLARALAARTDRYMTANKELIGAAFAGTSIVLPTLPVNGRMTLDLGGRTLELEAEPTAHTDNDLLVTDTATGTLFLGDVLFSGHIPVIDGSIRGWLALLEKLEKRPASRAVPGHGPVSLPWPDAMGPQRRYLEVVAADVRRLIKEGRTLSDATAVAGRSEKEAWLLFEDFHARNVSAAFAELEWE